MSAFPDSTQSVVSFMGLEAINHKDGTERQFFSITEMKPRFQELDAEAIKRTLDTKTTWFWSRSRKEYWNKGATSGNTQAVIDVRYDCDSDAILMLVDPAGPACHTGETSCFYRSMTDDS